MGATPQEDLIQMIQLPKRDRICVRSSCPGANPCCQYSAGLAQSDRWKGGEWWRVGAGRCHHHWLAPCWHGRGCLSVGRLQVVFLTVITSRPNIPSLPILVSQKRWHWKGALLLKGRPQEKSPGQVDAPRRCTHPEPRPATVKRCSGTDPAFVGADRLWCRGRRPPDQHRYMCSLLSRPICPTLPARRHRVVTCFIIHTTHKLTQPNALSVFINGTKGHL